MFDNVSPAIRAKADGYLTEGQVTVTMVTPTEVEAEVRGSEAYQTRYASGLWTCSCPARVPVCAHIFAVSLITSPTKTSFSFSAPSSDIDALFEGLNGA